MNLEITWNTLATISDPEIPVLTILDLGIVKNVEIEDETVTVTITPTYTGCPAMDMISTQIRMAMLSLGFKTVNIKTVLTPAWTTDWISETGKQKLNEYGIAPPNKKFVIASDGITCPQCNSTNTRLISEFGSTACKSLLQCNDCKEPFDYFKCH
jgi:ring-1,2-phenylacetyl-CoA epoxidase subunit PaaD